MSLTESNIIIWNLDWMYNVNLSNDFVLQIVWHINWYQFAMRRWQNTFCTIGFRLAGVCVYEQFTPRTNNWNLFGGNIVWRQMTIVSHAMAMHENENGNRMRIDVNHSRKLGETTNDGFRRFANGRIFPIFIVVVVVMTAFESYHFHLRNDVSSTKIAGGESFKCERKYDFYSLSERGARNVVRRERRPFCNKSVVVSKSTTLRWILLAHSFTSETIKIDKLCTIEIDTHHHPPSRTPHTRHNLFLPQEGHEDEVKKRFRLRIFRTEKKLINDRS